MHLGIYFICLLLCLNMLGVKSHDCDTKAHIVCYYGSWALYRTELGQFTTNDIDPQLCTNIIYSFVGLDINLEITSLDTNADIARGGFANFTKLKEQNPCLRTTLALGGWNEGSLKYSVLASTEESRNHFADNVLKFLIHYGFDGLDLDWEYPTIRGGISDDKANFNSLLQNVKSRIEPWGLNVSIAVALNDEYYNVEEIADNVDYVHLMAYDITPATSEVTGLLAPLSVIKERVNTWISRGIPASKLILGIPTYAHCYNLASSEHGIGAPVKTTTCGGEYTNENGFLAYYEVKALITNGLCDITERVDDNNYSVCDNDTWITYDSEETVAAKTNYALEAGLGGVMVWSLDTDDFLGTYGQRHSLVTSIYNTIHKKINKS